MKTFKDCEARNWAVAINVGSIKRCRDMAGVDLVAIIQGDGIVIGKLVSDPVVLIDALYALCKPEIDQRQLTQDQFTAGITGDVITSAMNALLDDLIDFFPKGRREVLAAAIAKIRQADSLHVQTAAEMVANLDLANLDPPVTGADIWKFIWQSAGAIGVDPAGLTLREICLMVEGHQRDAWERTSNLLAMLYNINRGPKTAPASADQFSPFTQAKKKAPANSEKVSIRDLRGVFMGAFGAARNTGELIGGGTKSISDLLSEK